MKRTENDEAKSRTIEGAFPDGERFTTEQKIARILMAVCAKHAYVNYPIQIINTGNTDVTIIRDEGEGLLFAQYKKRKGKPCC